MTDLPKITEPEKERVKAFHTLFKCAPTQITEEMRKDLKAINDKAWNIAKERTLPVDDRIAAHDVIKPIHEILGMKYDDNWKPKASSGGRGGGTYIATFEQRRTNCNEFIAYVGKETWKCLTPFEIVTILAKVWDPVKS